MKLVRLGNKAIDLDAIVGIDFRGPADHGPGEVSVFMAGGGELRFQYQEGEVLRRFASALPPFPGAETLPIGQRMAATGGPPGDP